MMETIDIEKENEEFDSIAQKKFRSVKKKNRRRRRRSSARFLKLSPEDAEEDDAMLSTQNLSQVYQNAIRMNAENKINASNSWNLNLIDHLDRFVTSSGSSQSGQTQIQTDSTSLQAVNFTKASCTLDASVKIYSYRVDDVHLTSYKVLANLNRTETSNSKKLKVTGKNSEDTNTTQRRSELRKTETETLEQNLANINVAKLDEAFDIDPLFHKMSKTFDEGGAKGLLLANLGSSLKGCNIVFDSTLETEQEETSADVPVSDGENNSNSNIAFLQQKLESHLNGQPIHVLSLVPQLKSLRQEFASLEQEGHVEALSKGKKQYAAPQEEELVADRSIHLEAIERSRASQAELGRSLMDHDSDDDDGYGPVDLGGNNDFDDGEVDEFEFGNNTNIHDGNHRFSSSSFQQTFEASQPPSQATMLLDALATGEISFSANSSQEFFSSYTLESLSQKNLWAGAAHWKKIPVKKPKSANNEDTSDSKFVKSKKKAKPKHNVSTLLRLLEPVEDLDDIMRKPPKSKKKGVNPLQLSKTMLTKHAKNDNLLPEDAGLALQNLSSLFMRPTLNLAEFNILTNSQQTTSKKHVGFGGIEFDDYDDHDNDGPGFEFGGGDDSFQQEGFVMPELEGIRKVNKVHVGYATVAKKVDVKRLKKDLWQELHQRFETMDEEKEDNDPLGLDSQSTIESSITSTTKTRKASLGSTSSADPEALSFQDTIQKMKSSQTQSDVTLPFYFICVLHLANEKGLALESQGLQDFIIHSS